MLKSLFFSLALVLSVQILFAQQTTTVFWSDITEQNISNSAQSDRFIFPVRYRTVNINVQVLKDQLKNATAESQGVMLTLPMPDGTQERFLVWEASVMHPDLQAKYPEIRCYTGRGIDDPYAMLKCDVTPQGFHAMTLGSTKGQFFIDPYFHGDQSVGIVYFKKDYERTAEDHFECKQVSEGTENWQELTTASPKKSGVVPDAAGDCQKRKYRLALSCTGEYSNFHGGTKPLVLAAMNTTMNRVNGVYEKDLAITMEIIPNNDTLIFLVASSDPFSNNDGGTMLGQNQTTVTARIGAANYDIGHVFSTGGGGIAGLGVVCNNGSKARGVTGGGSPIGDAFDIDYVAHEMGHQFGGQHSFNNSCGGNINASTAMEPGSGSSIMAYAGICSPNVQNNSDDYFHAISIQNISTFSTTGTGNNCPVKTVTGNTAPVVADVPNYTIPKSTPFQLTASATDADGDPMTYCWEQMNQQSATMPPVSTSVNGPLFRSYDPVPSPTRYFPRLQDLVNNVNSTWEELPGVARTMNFRVTVRDNHAGAGCTHEDNVTITVAGTSGPFAVTEPNTNVTWYAGEPKTVTWNVASSDVAPVSCANVKITLSTDGGFTYPVVLAENVPNNGTANITVPNNLSNTCRVRVEGVGNIFFDISNVNFRILEPLAPTFVLSANATAVQTCAGIPADMTISSSPLAGFLDTILYTVAGLPMGVTAVFTPEKAAPGVPVTLNITGLTSAMTGSYAVVITGTSGVQVKTTTVNLSVLPGKPDVAAILTIPADGTTGVGVSTPLVWGSVPFAEDYTIEVCTNPSFAAPFSVTTLSATGTTVNATGLSAATTYYWRVRSSNNCGESANSLVFAFQTGGEQCGLAFNSTNVPIAIDVQGVVNIASSLVVNATGTISDVNVNTTISHTWVGDLEASLVSPANDTILLFDRPGFPAASEGCDGDNLNITLDDEAVFTAEELENACAAQNPSIGGAFRSIETLSALDATAVQGTWKLLVKDNYGGFDAGALEAWGLNFCTTGILAAAQMIYNLPLNTVTGTTKAIAASLLTAQASATTASVHFVITGLPQYGSVAVNGITLGIGGHFTQADINAGVVTYTHNGSASLTDQFTFDVLDQNNDAWLHAQVFNINILQNTLSVNASVTAALSCFEGSNGQVTVDATGGNAPLSYAINGGASQSSNVFTGLSAGNYQVVVTDALGFTQSFSGLSISNPAAISISSNVVFDDLTLTATGGTGALEYSIDGINYQASGLFEDLADGVYTYTVKDANGCTKTGQVAVSVSALLTTVTQSAANLCFGQAQAAITVTAVGGFAPYEYSLNGVDYQQSNEFTGLAAATYTVVVRDANGTTASANAVVTAPSAVSASATVNQNSVTVVATGGTGALSYALNGGTAQSSPVFTTLANGEYVIVVTDINGCSATTTATVAVGALTILGSNVTNVQPCTGNFDLVIDANGGVAPLEYRINNGTWQSGAAFLNLTPGTYNFDVRDAAGVVVAGNTINTMPPAPVIGTAGVVGNDVQISVAGGTSPYTYTLPGGPSNTTGSFMNLSNDTYTVNIVDANGCTGQVTFNINYLPMSATTIVTNIACFGGTEGSIAFTVSGGALPYSSSTPLPLIGLAAGIYTVTITDAAGSTLVVSATVTEPPLLTLGAVANGNGTITATGTGGTPPYSYSINGGANYQTSDTFVNVVNGTYSIIVRDAKGCTATLTGLEVVDAYEIANNWGISVSPNPGNGLFVLRMEQAPKGLLDIQVYDALGQQVLSKQADTFGNAYQDEIVLTGMPSGVYFMRLSDGTGTKTILLEVK